VSVAAATLAPVVANMASDAELAAQLFEIGASSRAALSSPGSHKRHGESGVSLNGHGHFCVS
jgi:hypothetical protein